MDWLDAKIGLLTLTALEIVLGIDSILSAKLPKAEQPMAQFWPLRRGISLRTLQLTRIAIDYWHFAPNPHLNPLRR